MKTDNKNNKIKYPKIPIKKNKPKSLSKSPSKKSSNNNNNIKIINTDNNYNDNKINEKKYTIERLKKINEDRKKRLEK